MTEPSQSEVLPPSNAQRFLRFLVRHWPAVIVVTILALQVGVRLFYPYHMTETGAFFSVADTGYPDRLIIFPLLWLVYSEISVLVQPLLFGPSVFMLIYRRFLKSLPRLFPILTTAGLLLLTCRFLMELFFSGTSYYYNYQNSVNTNGNVYHLITFTLYPEFGKSSAAETKSVILECEVFGILCQQTYVSETAFGESSAIPDINLILDESTNELQLVVTGKIWHTMPIE